jgi:hypothetical protein
MKNNIKKITVLLFFALVPIFNLLAQPLPGTNDEILTTGTQLNCNPVLTPVGNGYWIFLALAFGYGIYKIWQMRKAETPA